MKFVVPENPEKLKTSYINMCQRVDELEELIRLMQKQRFGASSEKLNHPGMEGAFS